MGVCKRFSPKHPGLNDAADKAADKAAAQTVAAQNITVDKAAAERLSL